MSKLLTDVEWKEVRTNIEHDLPPFSGEQATLLINIIETERSERLALENEMRRE